MLHPVVYVQIFHIKQNRQIQLQKLESIFIFAQHVSVCANHHQGIIQHSKLLKLLYIILHTMQHLGLHGQIYTSGRKIGSSLNKYI
jgi:hypothetical protein